MTDFIKDYGEVLVTCIIAVMAWRALKEWKKQQKVAKAEEYVGLLWQLKDAAIYDLELALIDDIMDNFHLKIRKAKERTFLVSTMINLMSIRSQLLLMTNIFPKIAKNMYQLNDDIMLIRKKTHELQENIRDEFQVSQAEYEEKKSQAFGQVADFFTNDNELIKRIQKTHTEIHKYLADYIVKGLK